MMSLMPGHQCTDHRMQMLGLIRERWEMEGDGQMGLSILLLSLLIFLPPSVPDHDTHWLHNREQGGHSKYFSSNITNYVFIDLLSICQNHKADFFKFCVFLRNSELYQVIFGTKFKFSENQSTLRFHYSYWAPSILLRSRHYGKYFVLTQILQIFVIFCPNL